MAEGGHRTQRLAAEIRQILAEAATRGDIKDPRVQDAGLVTFTHVKVTGDLREAKVYFMVHGANDKTLAEVRKGLQSASGYLRRLLGDELRLRVVPSLAFEVDRVFEQEAKVDALLAEIAREKK